MVAAHEALSLRVTALDGRGVLTSGVYGLVPPGLPDSSTHPSTFRYLGLQTSAIDGQNVHNSKILRQYAGRAKAIAQQSHDAQQLKHLLRTDLPGAVDYFSTITYLQPCTLRESSRAIARNALPALGLANFQRKYPDPTTTETLLMSPTELTGGLHLAMPLRATQLLKSQTAILRLAHIRHDMGHALLINGLAEPKDDIARLNTNGNHLHALRGSGLLLHSREADSEAQALRRRTHADADPPPHHHPSRPYTTPQMKQSRTWQTCSSYPLSSYTSRSAQKTNGHTALQDPSTLAPHYIWPIRLAKKPYSQFTVKERPQTTSQQPPVDNTSRVQRHTALPFSWKCE